MGSRAALAVARSFREVQPCRTTEEAEQVSWWRALRVDRMTTDGGGANGGATVNPVGMQSLIGGPRPGLSATLIPGGGGGGAAMLIACRGSVAVSGTIDAGGGGGSGGVGQVVDGGLACWPPVAEAPVGTSSSRDWQSISLASSTPTAAEEEPAHLPIRSVLPAATACGRPRQRWEGHRWAGAAEERAAAPHLRRVWVVTAAAPPPLAAAVEARAVSRCTFRLASHP